MTRLIVIAALIGIAFMLIKYRANEKVQKGVVVTLLGAFAIYVVYVVVSELFR
jgi:threonine/homoserine efflux transporter RhtA